MLLIALFIGLIVGAIAVWAFMSRILSKEGNLNKHLNMRVESLQEQIQTQDQLIDTFKAISGDTFAAHITKLTELSEGRLKGAGELISQDLASKKSAIDSSLGDVNQRLREVMAASSEIKEGLQNSQDQTLRLREVTTGLQQVLSSSQARGSWGERMVEDIIQKLGMVEGVNYQKQQTIKTGERPDFTFILPAGKSIHLDVKFPMANYEKHINAENEPAAAAAALDFIKDVKGHIKTLASRGYVNEKTVDYVILFIPNESIYGFIHHYAPDIMDFAMDNKVVLASPINLYAVLSLIRQSIKSFAMSEKASEMMELLGKFKGQWGKYVEVQTKMGEGIARLQKQYDDMVGTRTRSLDRVISNVAEIEAGDETLKIEIAGDVGIGV